MEYKFDKRPNFIPITETHPVPMEFPHIVKLRETPDMGPTVTVPNSVRVYTLPANPNEFFVNRNGDVYFHTSKKGTSVTITYMGGGSRLAAADWNLMIDSLTRANSLIDGLTSLVFGNVKLRVTPTAIATPVSQLNQANSGSFIQSFTCSLVTNTNQVYTWLPNIPMYLSVRKVFVDADIAAPVISPAGNLQFVHGACQFTATYSTDYGAYKKYTSGDYVAYEITTVDPSTSVGINLTTTVNHSIQ
jgi:hypothetical protein